MPNDKSPIDLLKSQSQNYQPFLKTFQQSEDIKRDELFGLLTSTFPASGQPESAEEPLDESAKDDLFALIKKNKSFFVNLLKFQKQKSSPALLFDELDDAIAGRDIDAIELALYRVLYFTNIKL